MLDRTQLEKLRNEIILGSCFVNDYENSLNICPNNVYLFFESYMDELAYLMGEKGITDSQFWDYLEEYDTIDNLENFYSSYEDDPLPYDSIYEYMVDNYIDWGNGQSYENLRKNMQN